MKQILFFHKFINFCYANIDKLNFHKKRLVYTILRQSFSNTVYINNRQLLTYLYQITTDLSFKKQSTNHMKNIAQNLQGKLIQLKKGKIFIITLKFKT